MIDKRLQATQIIPEEVDPMAMDTEVSVVEEVEPTGGPTVTEDGDGNVTVDFSAEAEVNKILGDTHDANLAEFLSDEVLTKISEDVINGYDVDLESCQEWFDLVEDGISILGLKIEEKSEPWEGACSSKHPLLLESVVKYQAKARSQLLPPGGPVKTEVIGLRTEAKLQRANRVRQFMNYQITEQMPEYSREHDRMLFSQGFTGMAFTKMYNDKAMARPVSRFIKPQDFIVNYYASDLETAERYTHKIEMSKNELRKYQIVGVYRDIELETPSVIEDDLITNTTNEIDGKSKPANDEDTRYTILEQHVDYSIPGYEHKDSLGVTEMALPFIVTVEKSSGKILSIRRNWKEADPLKKKCLYFVDWPMIPGFGFYGYGYLHLIGALAKTATSTWQQLADAGTAKNLPGGFIARGTRISEPNDPVAPGMWKVLNSAGDDIKKSVMPFPYGEPSPTLMALLDKAVDWGKNLADNTEAVIADSTNYGPVGTTMALLDASGKLFSAVHERLFESQRQELRILARLDAENLTDEYPYDVVGDNRKIFKEDFNEFVDIIPVTNPRTPSEAHRLARANASLAVAGQFPDLHNMREVLLDVHSALGADDPTRFLAPLPPDAKTGDPVTENIWMLNGIPVKAAPQQDHMSHAKVAKIIIDDPLYNVNQKAVMAAQAHIMEHMSQHYTIEMQKLMGVQLPQEGTPMAAMFDNAIAVRASQATDMLLQKDLAAAQPPQADPMIQVANRELDIRQMEVMLKKEIEGIKAQLKKYDIDQRHIEKLETIKGDVTTATITSTGEIKEQNIQANADILIAGMNRNNPKPTKE